MNAAILFDNFRNISNAPGGVMRLRDLILSFATQGKLAPQDPADSSVDALLSQIVAKKRKLIEEKRIRQSQEAWPISEDEIPFNIPASWRWARLSDITYKIHYGFTASAKRQITEVRLLRITDIQDNSVNWQLVPGCEIAPEDVPQYKLEPGDILVARTGGTIGKTYSVRDVPVVAVFASYLIRIQRASALSDHYLKFFLESPAYWNQLWAGARGAAQPNVNGQTLGRMVVPIPPRAEQKRIVAKVNELMALCGRLETQQQERQKLFPILSQTSHYLFTSSPNLPNLKRIFDEVRQVSPDDLRKSILSIAVQGKLVSQDRNDQPAEQLLGQIRKQRVKLLGSDSLRKTKPCRQFSSHEVPHDIPETWIWTMLGEITDIGTGSTPSRSEASFWTAGSIPWVTSGSTSRSQIIMGDEFVTPAAVKAHRLRVYPPGTLLVALYGQGKTRGQVAVLNIPATINQACAAVCALDGIPPMQGYLKLLLEKQYDEMRSLSAGGAQPNLNVQKIKEVFVPLPPLAEQHRIVAKVDQLMALIDTLEEQQQERDHLAETFAKAVVVSLTGTQIAERKEKMKAPKTELISPLSLGAKPKDEDDAPLAALLIKAKGHELPAKSLWQQSGLTIDAFYQQLKFELVHGWIAPPKEAEMKVVEEGEDKSISTGKFTGHGRTKGHGFSEGSSQ